MTAKNWYVVCTRLNCEKKVVDNFSKKGIECFCPQNSVVNISFNKRKIERKPLFQSFVFVKVNSLQLGEIKRFDGVINFLYWLDKPAIIREVEIDMMKRFLMEHSNIQLEKSSVNLSDIVKILNEPFAEEQNDENSYTKKVKLILPTLGYSLIAKVNVDTPVVVEKTKLVQFNPSAMEKSLNYGI